MNHFINQKRIRRRRRLVEVSVFSILAFACFVFVAELPVVIPHIVKDISATSQYSQTILGVTGEEFSGSIVQDEPLKFYSKAEGQDVRAYVLDEYFKANESPLYGTGHIFARNCNALDVPQDCLAVAAIARAETDLCKYSNSASYYNCWGFGGGGIYRIYFDSWDEGIDRVFDSLAHSYGYKYMVDPRLMETTFCGDEPGCTGWGLRVMHFMDQIDQFAKDIGVKSGMYSFRDPNRTE